MSTQYNAGTIASNCIDGVTTYASSCTWPCSQPYMCATLGNPQDWLVVTVTGYSVDKIKVYNIIECCRARINNAKLIYSYDFAGTSIIHQASFGTSASLVYTFDFSTTTYVRIQQTNTDYLNLVEVEMYYNNVKVPISG